MKGADLIRVEQYLKLDAKGLALALGTPYRTYMRWRNEESRVPGCIDILIKLILQFTDVRSYLLKDCLMHTSKSINTQPSAEG